jgi:predicted glycoside hydrolase/deacetylase ChbG (UPF0249 family)
MKQLIVSADDLGLTKSTNEGILLGWKEGIVTNINFISSGSAAEDAIGLLKYNKVPEIGVHLALTETAPLTNPRLIRSLIEKSGRFPASHSKFLSRLLSGKIDTEHIKTEFRSQMNRAAQSGARITNISSHEHIHMIPIVMKAFIEIAKEYKIPYIRLLRREKVSPPLSPKKLYRLAVVSCFEGIMKMGLRKSGLHYTDNFMGFLDSGALTENVLIGMIKNLKEGVTELVAHPGFLGPEILDNYRFHINCEEELYALTSPKVKRLIAESGIKLVRFGDLL